MALLKRPQLRKGRFYFSFKLFPHSLLLRQAVNCQKKVHPVNEQELRDIPAREANGDEIFSG